MHRATTRPSPAGKPTRSLGITKRSGASAKKGRKTLIISKSRRQKQASEEPAAGCNAWWGF